MVRVPTGGALIRAILTTVALVAALAVAASARADAKADAKRHFEAGKSLMQSEDYAAAALEFEESYRLYKTKGAVFNLANCYKALKRFDDELAALDTLEEEFGAAIDADMKSLIAGMREDVETTTGTIEVKGDQPGAAVFVDGEQVGTSPLAAPLRLAPGVHEVRVEADGMAPYAEKVKLLSGDKMVIKVALVPAPAPVAADRPPEPDAKPEEATEPQPTQPAAPAVPPGGEGPRRSPALLAVSVIGTAVTVGLGIGGGVFWKKAFDAKNDYDGSLKAYGDLDPSAPEYSADEERVYGDLVDTRGAMTENNNVAVGLTVGAGVAAAASVVFWILYANSGDESAEPAAALAPAPGGVGVVF